MEIIVVVSIALLYVVFTVFKKPIERIIPLKICAICSAVSVTWGVLLLGYLFELFPVDPILIGVLMGGSVVGIMYKLEDNYKKRKLRNFWIIRICVITLGFLAVYYILSKRWEPLVLIVVLSVVVAIVAPVISKKETSKKDSVEKKFKKMGIDFDDCC